MSTIRLQVTSLGARSKARAAPAQSQGAQPPPGCAGAYAAARDPRSRNTTAALPLPVPQALQQEAAAVQGGQALPETLLQPSAALPDTLLQRSADVQRVLLRMPTALPQSALLGTAFPYTAQPAGEGSVTLQPAGIPHTAQQPPLLGLHSLLPPTAVQDNTTQPPAASVPEAAAQLGTPAKPGASHGPAKAQSPSASGGGLLRIISGLFKGQASPTAAKADAALATSSNEAAPLSAATDATASRPQSAASAAAVAQSAGGDDRCAKPPGTESLAIAIAGPSDAEVQVLLGLALPEQLLALPANVIVALSLCPWGSLEACFGRRGGDGGRSPNVLRTMAMRGAHAWLQELDVGGLTQLLAPPNASAEACTIVPARPAAAVAAEAELVRAAAEYMRWGLRAAAADEHGARPADDLHGAAAPGGGGPAAVRRRPAGVPASLSVLLCTTQPLCHFALEGLQDLGALHYLILVGVHMHRMGGA